MENARTYDINFFHVGCLTSSIHCLLVGMEKKVEGHVDTFFMQIFNEFCPFFPFDSTKIGG